LCSHPADEGIEQGLCLAVDPVEVLENQQKRLLTRFAQQQLPNGIKRATAALRRIESFPSCVVYGHVEQAQEYR